MQNVSQIRPAVFQLSPISRKKVRNQVEIRIQDPDCDQDRVEKLISSSLAYIMPACKISAKSIHSFLIYAGHRQTQTDRQTFQKQNLLGGGNNYIKRTQKTHNCELTVSVNMFEVWTTTVKPYNCFLRQRFSTFFILENLCPKAPTEEKIPYGIHYSTNRLTDEIYISKYRSSKKFYKNVVTCEGRVFLLKIIPSK